MTKTEKLNKQIQELKKPKKQVKVRYENGYTCMLKVDIARKLEKKGKIKVLA